MASPVRSDQVGNECLALETEKYITSLVAFSRSYYTEYGIHDNPLSALEESHFEVPRRLLEKPLTGVENVRRLSTCA